MLVWHAAPRSSRDSIRAHGIDHTRGASAYAAVIDYPPGNYVFTVEADAHAYAAMRTAEEADHYGADAETYDVWRAVVDPADLTPDPLADGRPTAYLTRPIPPDQLT